MGGRAERFPGARGGLTAGPLPLGEALAIAARLAEALEEAHRHSIVHRDLKPANVKLPPVGRAKVLDFGLAKARADEAPAGADATTVAGAVMGTPGYMSPEQARGEDVDARTDVWAFGCVLYEMLTGCRAFSAASASDAIAAVLRDDVAWDRVQAACPEPLLQLLHECLEKDASARAVDFAAIRRRLADVPTA